MSSEIRGIVFDLDGTLIHSSIDFIKMKQRMIEILEVNGIPEGRFTPKQTTVVIMAEAKKIWKVQEKDDMKIAGTIELIEEMMNVVEFEAVSEIKAIQDASDTLKKLREMGYKLAILTRSHHAYAIEALKRIGAIKYFDVVLGRHETPRAKPYAEALQYTAKLMRLSLEQLVFVGDNHIDHNSAINANCTFIGVKTGPRGDRSWAQNRPKILLESVAELPNYLAE